MLQFPQGRFYRTDRGVASGSTPARSPWRFLPRIPVLTCPNCSAILAVYTPDPPLPQVCARGFRFFGGNTKPSPLPLPASGDGSSSGDALTVYNVPGWKSRGIWPKLRDDIAGSSGMRTVTRWSPLRDLLPYGNRVDSTLCDGINDRPRGLAEAPVMKAGEEPR